jgi:hypothetical protein
LLPIAAAQNNSCFQKEQLRTAASNSSFEQQLQTSAASNNSFEQQLLSTTVAAVVVAVNGSFFQKQQL